MTEQLMLRAVKQIRDFCNYNNIDVHPIIVAVSKKTLAELSGDHAGCGLFIPRYHVYVCLESCAKLTKEGQVRNWNWPGNTTDRTPYGVTMHEFGHFVDDYISRLNHGRSFSSWVHAVSLEKPISGYAPNDSEWFAEMFRVYMSNPQLLQLIRPKAYDAIERKLTGHRRILHWRAALNCEALGTGPVLDRIVNSLKNKIHKSTGEIPPKKK